MLKKDWWTRRYCIARFVDFMWSMMIKFTKVDEFFINYSGKYLYWIFVNYIARIKSLSKEVFILFQFMSLFSVHFSWLMEFVGLGVQVSRTENLRQWRRRGIGAGYKNLSRFYFVCVRECENGCVCVYECGSLSVLKSVCRDMVNGVVFSIDTVTYEQQSM